MISIGLLGAGRIGQIHGGNIAASPRARLVAVADPMPEGAKALAKATGAPVRRRDEILADKGHRRRADRHADRHPCRLHRAGGQGRQGGVLREAGRSRARRASRPAWNASRRPATPLMIGFNRRFDPNFAALQKRLDDGDVGEVETGDDPVARSRPAAGLLHRALGRPVPRHDDPRFRHGALPARRGAGRGASPSARRWSIRRSARRATSTRRRCCCKTASRQDLPDLQFAPRHLRLRPAHRGARLQGHAPRRQHPRDDGASSPAPSGFTADPVQNFFLERYASAYQAELDAFIDAMVRRARRRRRTATTG